MNLTLSTCDLCPRSCGVDRAAGERGACGADGRLVVARAALHFWEEPPISGSRGSGTVFFAHCPLRCVYCQNAVIAAGEAGAEVSVERLCEMCLELQEQGALNVNFVTPTHYAPEARAAVAWARERGLALPVVWNTSGYETVAAVRSTRTSRISNTPTPSWRGAIRMRLITPRSPWRRSRPWWRRRADRRSTRWTASSV